jgi:hypothetical protein
MFRVKDGKMTEHGNSAKITMPLPVYLQMPFDQLPERK